jgi:hypothetical protein
MIRPSRMTGAPIIRPLMYCELMLPGRRTAPPTSAPPCTRSGTQPGLPRLSIITPSVSSAVISGAIGRSRMRGTPSIS